MIEKVEQKITEILTDKKNLSNQFEKYQNDGIQNQVYSDLIFQH